MNRATTPLPSPSQAAFAAQHDATFGWAMTSGEVLFYRQSRTRADRWLVDRDGTLVDHVQFPTRPGQPPESDRALLTTEAPLQRSLPPAEVVSTPSLALG
jgi:hypothetical protein